jgi:hypothetical protein
MVWDLQDIGSQVDPGVEQGVLGLDFGVAGQEDSNAPHLGPEHQGRIVRVGSRAPKRPRRTEDVDRDVARTQRRPDDARFGAKTT